MSLLGWFTSLIGGHNHNPINQLPAEGKQDSINQLPKEIIFEIFSHL